MWEVKGDETFLSLFWFTVTLSITEAVEISVEVQTAVSIKLCANSKKKGGIKVFHIVFDYS